MFHAVLSQVVSAPGSLVFDTGLMLLYLTKLGFSDKVILLMLSSRMTATMLLVTSAAYISDRIGIKRIGMMACVLTMVGYVLITFAASFDDAWARHVIVTGVVIFSVGLAMFNSGWFPLLKGFVPPKITGRFFGFLRMSWQLGVTLVVFGYSAFLQSDSQLWVFQIVLGIILLGQVAKLWSYSRIPEVGQSAPATVSFIGALKQVLPTPQFMPFCAYTFVLTLFTMAVPTLFNLTEKHHLQMGDNTIAMLGGAAMVGALAGYPLGGFIVDRFGTKVVFLCCHLGFMCVAGSFPLRSFVSIDPMLYLGTLHLLWGVLLATSSIAMSTELFAVMPPHNRSLATAIWWSLSNGGSAMSGMLAAGAISIGFLKPEWELLGRTVSQYDAVLLVFGGLTGLMAVTLGLVPSVIGKHQWMPRAS